MPGGGITVSTEVVVRDRLGQFIRDIEGAATKVVEESLKVGVAAARAQAPQRTGRLRGSFQPVVISRTRGLFINTAPYAAAQDQGARPHPITAYVSFYWDKVGRPWMHPDVYERVTGHPGADPIHHPGNPATHFMLAGYRAMAAAMPGIVRRAYPS